MEKKNFKEKIVSILFVIILVIASYQLVANVKRIANLGVRTKIYLSEKEVKQVNENIEKLRENTKKINTLSEGYYTKDELDELKKRFNMLLKESEDVYNFLKSNKDYNSLDILNGLNQYNGLISERKIYDIIYNHKIINENEYKLFISNLKQKLMVNSSKFTYNADIIEETGALKFRRSEIFYEIRSYISALEYYTELSNLVLESEVIKNEK